VGAIAVATCLLIIQQNALILLLGYYGTQLAQRSVDFLAQLIHQSADSSQHHFLLNYCVTQLG
jgi:hypothetical protein